MVKLYVKKINNLQRIKPMAEHRTPFVFKGKRAYGQEKQSK